MPLARLYVCSDSSSLVRLRVPSRFLVRPQFLTRLEPIPAEKDIPGASRCPFVATDHAVGRPQRVDAQIRRHLCAHLPLHGVSKILSSSVREFQTQIEKPRVFAKSLGRKVKCARHSSRAHREPVARERSVALAVQEITAPAVRI
jgi:hypothetical protein